MILQRQIIAASSIGRISGTAVGAGGIGVATQWSTGPELMAGVSYVMDSMDYIRHRTYLAFDTSVIPADATLMGCVLVLTGVPSVSDYALPILWKNEAWANPLTAATQSKFERMAPSPHVMFKERRIDDPPGRIAYSIDLLLQGIDRAALGQRYSCGIVAAIDVNDTWDFWSDILNVTFLSRTTPNPKEAPRLSVSYRVPGSFAVPGRTMKQPKLDKGEPRPKVFLNIQDSQLR